MGKRGFSFQFSCYLAMRLSNQLTSTSSRFSSKGEYAKHIFFSKFPEKCIFMKLYKCEVVELLNKRGKDIHFFQGSLTQLDYDQVPFKYTQLLLENQEIICLHRFFSVQKELIRGSVSKSITNAQKCWSMSLKHLLPPPLVIWSPILTNELPQACFCMQVGESSSEKQQKKEIWY